MVYEWAVPYVDDTFMIFKDLSRDSKFLDYLNSQHGNIKFTMESESNNNLLFLDMTVTRNHNKLRTSISRKPTFSGLCMSFFHISFQNLKLRT